ncbi:MAG: hypothetical protein Q9M26_08220 [Mariprofundales bacterium]|nr:hypothetical protein [Mariprofundales bacterium]
MGTVRVMVVEVREVETGPAMVTPEVFLATTLKDWICAGIVLVVWARPDRFSMTVVVVPLAIFPPPPLPQEDSGNMEINAIAARAQDFDIYDKSNIRFIAYSFYHEIGDPNTHRH